MDTSNLQSYIIPIALGGFILWRFGRFFLLRKQLPELIKKGAVIVDVRSAAEFSGGSSKNSINIPLDRLESALGRLDPEKPVILCCASGTRSGMAASLLRRKGFRHVVNAGPWRNTSF